MIKYSLLLNNQILRLLVAKNTTVDMKQNVAVPHPGTVDTVAPGLKYHKVLIPAVDPFHLMSHCCSPVFSEPA